MVEQFCFSASQAHCTAGFPSSCFDLCVSPDGVAFMYSTPQSLLPEIYLTVKFSYNPNQYTQTS